jgi:hypothetical protein
VSKKRARNERVPAEIEVGAVAKAKAIRFEKVPETEINFPGSDEERSGSHTERENLPDEVEPGVTYRDVTVRWRARAAVRAEVADEVRDELEEPDTVEGRE